MKTLRVIGVAAKLDISVALVWRMAQKTSFPKPFKLHHNVTVWDEEEIDAWLNHQKEHQHESK